MYYMKSNTSIRNSLGIEPNQIALNIGSWGPICTPAIDAMTEFHEQTFRGRTQWDSYAGLVFGLMDEDRACMADLLGCSSSEISLCESTTKALNIVLWGMNLQPGDEILYSNLENPAAEIPLWTIAQRNNVKLIKADIGLGESTIEVFKNKITPNTKLILISEINYVNGERVDLAKICEMAHSNGTFVLADGIQAIGAVPVDVRASKVDAYACARHKFACGPDGAGALYIREESRDKVLPTFTGVSSTTMYAGPIPDFGPYRWSKTGERYEVSTRDFSSFVGGTAAIRWLSESVGLDWVYQTIKRLRLRLWDKLNMISGVEIVSSREWDSGLLSFRVPGLDSNKILEQLASNQIIGRTIMYGEEEWLIRLSVGFWYRDSDIDEISHQLEKTISDLKDSKKD